MTLSSRSGERLVVGYAHGMHSVTLASPATTATLTVALAAYAAAILVAMAVAIDGARRRQRRRAIASSVIVGVLTLAGLVIAIVSSVV
ncbi:DUF4190 domain-containing protein [Mycobacterium intermedium]